MSYRNKFVLWLIVANSYVTSVSGETRTEQGVGLSQQTSLNITVYNQDFTLVTDQREVNLVAGANQLAIRDVCARLRPETTVLKQTSSARDLKLTEQRFDHDILTPGNLLEKYVGHKVHVLRTDAQSGDEYQEEAEVLSTRDGIVLKLKDRIETGIPGRMVFAEMPPNLHDRPTLSVKLIAKEDGDYTLGLTYLCSGITWQADYVAKLSNQDTQLELSGWATINNNTRSIFNNAQFKLASATKFNTILSTATASIGSDLNPGKRGSNPFDDPYALLYYNIPYKVSIGENQSLQVSLLNVKQIPVHKEYVFTGMDEYFVQEDDEIANNAAAQVRLRFLNNSDAHLGFQLPSGVVRFYKTDASGQVDFINEDRMAAVAVNEELNLNLNSAPDVTISKWQTMFDILPLDPEGGRSFLSGFRYTVKNSRNTSAKVVIEEPIPGDWEIIQESLPHKMRKGRCAWIVDVPAQGEFALKYNVRVTP
ncbi:MAG: hypothetical protein OEW08_02435 [Gammaproteobacteria bacterium]|nr:hypothetical protein [Gammaproteobacteria bacterium]